MLSPHEFFFLEMEQERLSLVSGILLFSYEPFSGHYFKR